MKLRWAVIPIYTAAVAVLAAGCASSTSPAPSSPGSGSSATIPLLTAGEVAPYSNIDPNKTQGCNDNFCGLFMEHLFNLSPQDQLEPELATSVTQPDPLTYVYHLRHGVHFWDGHPMTSADVVYSLNYQREPSAFTAVYFDDVKSIEPEGPFTVVIKLRQPNAGWKYSLSYEGVIFEKSFALAHKSTLGNPGTLIEATGPWEIKTYDPTSGMTMTANPHWWGGRVPVRQISVKFFSTETSEALAMRAGDIDLAFPSNGKSFAANSGARVTSWLSPTISFFSMDPHVGPWRDVHVRRAVAYALNRTDIVAAAGGPQTAVSEDTVIPVKQLLSLGTRARVSKTLGQVPQYPYSLASARQQMAESAYPHGFTAQSIIDSTGNDPNVAQVIAAELHKIGISLKVTEVPEAKYLADYSTVPPGGDMFAGLGAVSPDPSILPSYALGSQATYNVAHYAPPVINTLLARGLTTSNPAQRLAIYGQVLRQVGTDEPYVVLYGGLSFTALSGKFTLPGFYEYPAFFSWALRLRQAG